MWRYIHKHNRTNYLEILKIFFWIGNVIKWHAVCFTISHTLNCLGGGEVSVQQEKLCNSF